MDHDHVLAELDAQYQELIQSVQVEGVGPDERSEFSVDISIAHNGLENVSGIILKYQQTLHTTKEAFEEEIQKLETMQQRTESKYTESKNRVKTLESNIADLSTQITEMATISGEKDIKIDELEHRLQSMSSEQRKSSALREIQCRRINDLEDENQVLKQKEDDFNSLQHKYQELQMAHDMVSQKSTNIEKYKVELVETRNTVDDQKREIQDLHHQLKECRDEISFLCSTNENLSALNETLTLKMRRFPQYDTLYNSVMVSPVNEPSKVIIDKGDGQKALDLKDQIKSVSLSDTVSMDNLDCPKLDRTTSMFVMEHNADHKIIEELQRLSVDRNRWNQQYQAMATEKADLLQTIAKYQETVQQLQTDLEQAQLSSKESENHSAKAEGDKVKEQADMEHMEKIKALQSEVADLQQKQLNLEVVQNREAQLQADYVTLKEAKASCEVEIQRQQRLLEEFNVERLKNEKERKEMERLRIKVSELQIAMSCVDEDNEGKTKLHQQRQDALQREMQKWKVKCLALKSKAEEHLSRSQEIEMSSTRSNERYEALSKDYDAVKQQLHSAKLRLSEMESLAAEYSAQQKRWEINAKFNAEEIEQAKQKEKRLRLTNVQHCENIGRLNQDMKALFDDLETTRLHLAQSNDYIRSMEAESKRMTRELQQCRYQLQQQIQVNMHNAATMNQMRASCITSAMSSDRAQRAMRPATSPAPQPIISPATRPATSNGSNTNTNMNTNTNSKSMELSRPPQSVSYQLNLPQTRIPSPQHISNIFPTQPVGVRVNIPSQHMTHPNVQPQPPPHSQIFHQAQPQQQSHCIQQVLHQPANAMAGTKTTHQRANVSPIIPNDIMNLARGKPFKPGTIQSANQGAVSRQSQCMDQVRMFVAEKQRMETELFKLPTNARSLAQRKRKQYLERMIMAMDQQISDARGNSRK